MCWAARKSRSALRISQTLRLKPQQRGHFSAIAMCVSNPLDRAPLKLRLKASRIPINCARQFSIYRMAKPTINQPKRDIISSFILILLTEKDFHSPLQLVGEGLGVRLRRTERG